MEKQKKLIIGITAEGSVNLLLGQLAYFKSMGYVTYLLAPHSERSAAFCKKEGCEHLVLNIERDIAVWKDFKTLIQIIKIFRKVKPDIVNLGTPKISLLGMIAAFLLGIKKRIYTCRGFRFEHEKGAKRFILLWMEKITSRLAQEVICISPSVQELGLKNGVFNKRKSLVINKGSSNGTNLDLFNRSKIDSRVMQQITEKHGLEAKFVFGYIGRIIDRKGINELVEVFIEMFKDSLNIRLLLLGPCEVEQISNKKVLEVIESHPGIINIGRVMIEEVPNYMALMDVFVLPAWWEGFGNVLIEAAALGIPVISTNATGSKDAVAPGYNGLLVEKKDTNLLKEAMLRLLHDDKLRLEMGANGVVWSKNFNRVDIWNGMHKIYQKHV